MSRYRLTPQADADFVGILRETVRRFGPKQRAAYAGLIQAAIDRIAETPERPGSRRRDDLFPGIRLFHVSLAAQRKDAAAHVLVYRVGKDHIVEVLRILHDRMDPALHVAPSATN